jgi:hypothetical protein
MKATSGLHRRSAISGNIWTRVMSPPVLAIERLASLAG